MESSSSGRFPASSSYDGPRGGDAHDEELLKELRAISNKSNRRFDDDDTPSPPVDTAVKDQPPLAAVEELNSSQMDDLGGSLVKGHQDGAFDDSNMTNISNPTESCKKSPSPPKVDASETITGGFDKSNKFQGRNGGAAQDADLLAELMDITNKSSNRFFEEVGGQHCRDDCDGATSPNESTSLKQTILATQKKERNFPPWKRSEKDNEDATSNVFEISIATPPSAAVMPFNESSIQNNTEKFGKYDEASAVTTDEASTSKPLTTHGEFQSNDSLPKTFKGDRGGAAEDAALLAELRAISNKSSARFQEEDSMVAAPDPLVEGNSNKGSIENVCEAKAEQSLPPNPKTSSSPSQTLPPWKRKKSKKPAGADNVEIVIAEPSAPSGVSAPIAAPPSDNQEVSTLDDDRQQESSSASLTEPTTAVGSSVGHFQSNNSLPKTFKGDRGGAAEDAALLAELRAISNKSSARFQEEDSMVAVKDPLVEDNRNKGSIENVCEAKAEQSLPPNPKTSSSPSQTLPPWKRKKSKKPAGADDVEIVIAEPSAPSGVSRLLLLHRTIRNLPKTFKGDRGGAAEDAALLAELRAISNKSSARFQEEDSMFAVKDPLVEDNRNKGSIENVCEAKAEQSLPPNPKTSSLPSQTLPPWKRKKSKKPAGADDVEIVIAEPSAPCGIAAPIAPPPSDNQEHAG
eukprot:CCRYP_018696-RA/>CCRYP_018696-RA protein AED:0.08 eAED:0.10 QI:0/0/0/1/1/1/3/0/686